MGEAESRRVQAHAARGIVARAVGAVAHDGVSELGELGADLAAASGDERQLHQRRRGAALKHTITGDRLAALGAPSRAAHAEAAVFPQAASQRALALARDTFDEGNVVTLDPPRLELILEPTLDREGFGEHEQPRRLAIEAVDDEEPRRVRPPRSPRGRVAPDVI